MTTPVLAAAEAAFLSWAERLSPEDLPESLLAHAPLCSAGEAGCLQVEARFPFLRVSARCNGAEIIVPVALSWPRAIRGRTRDLRRALDRALEKAAALGLAVRIDRGYPASIHELTEERIVRLPCDPATATDRADVLLLLQRIAGAIGLFVTRPEVYSELAWTEAGLVALAMLEEFGVLLRALDLSWQVCHGDVRYLPPTGR